MRMMERSDHIFMWSTLQDQWRYLDQEDLRMWIVFEDDRSHRRYNKDIRFSSRRVTR